MERTRSCLPLVVVLVASTLAGHSVAQDPQPSWDDIPQKGPGYELLDRGATGTPLALTPPGLKTHMSPMATLSHPMAGPGITMVSIGFFPTMAPASFIGNFYTAPGDFPTSYYPFFITGAFAFDTGPPTMVVTSRRRVCSLEPDMGASRYKIPRSASLAPKSAVCGGLPVVVSIRIWPSRRPASI